jgi:hypothetical protein
MTDEKLVNNTHPEIAEVLGETLGGHTMENIEPMIATLKTFWDITNRIEADPTSFDLAMLKKRSDQLMKSIADLVTFPCINLIRGGMPDSIAKVIFALNYDIRDNRQHANFYYTCKACNDRCVCRGGDGIPEEELEQQRMELEEAPREE